MELNFVGLNNPTLIGVYIATITAISGICFNLLITFFSNNFQKNKEKRNQLQDIYTGCIKSLATVSTLSNATENNMDNIEISLVDAKKYLALLLIYTKESNQIKLNEEIHLFIAGQYQQILERASLNMSKLLNQSQTKYTYLQNERQKEVLITADIMLQIIINIGIQDQRLSL